jgi:anti-sigma regulatory factor (Ser/Thr protein kinase)
MSQIAAILDDDLATLSLPSRLEWVGPTAEFLAERAVSCGAIDAAGAPRLIIALHEALTNAIVHGNLGISSELKEQPGDAFARALAERSADPVLSARQVAVRFSYDGRECRISIRDQGAGFDVESWLATHSEVADDDVTDLRCSGRGIIMMRALVDEVSWHLGGREVVLTMRLPPRGERRAAARHAWTEPVRVVPLTVGNRDEFPPDWSAVGRDLSQTGMGLIQASGHTARRVLIELRGEAGGPMYVPAEVCRVTPLDGGLFELGCRFTAGPDAEAADTSPCAPLVVEKVLERLEAQSSHHERRVHPRVQYTGRIEVRSTGRVEGGEQDAGEFRPAFSRDLSRGGMAFVSSFEVPEGLVEVLLPAPDGAGNGDGTQRLWARVVRCQRVTSGVYDIGCQFTWTKLHTSM